MTKSLQDRCTDFGKWSLALISEKGECVETVEALVVAAGKITDVLADKTLKTCEYAGGVLDVKTVATVTLWNIYDHPDGWAKPESRLAEGWQEVREILEELAGIRPIRTHEREREDWVSMWHGLYSRGDAVMKEEVLKAARKRYPDLDLSLITNSGGTDGSDRK